MLILNEIITRYLKSKFKVINKLDYRFSAKIKDSNTENSGSAPKPGEDIMNSINTNIEIEKIDSH